MEANKSGPLFTVSITESTVPRKLNVPPYDVLGGQPLCSNLFGRCMCDPWCRLPPSGRPSCSSSWQRRRRKRFDLLCSLSHLGPNYIHSKNLKRCPQRCTQHPRLPAFLSMSIFWQTWLSGIECGVCTSRFDQDKHMLLGQAKSVPRHLLICCPLDGITYTLR